MYHRIVQNTGLGNPQRALLRNKGKKPPKKFCDAAVDAYFQRWEGFDYMREENCVSVGMEPSYQYERLLIINITRDKNDCHMIRGKSWGHYGSGVVKETRWYRDLVRNSKFKRFIDTWHPILFPQPPFDPRCNGYNYHVHTPGADKCSICGKSLALIRKASGA